MGGSLSRLSSSSVVVPRSARLLLLRVLKLSGLGVGAALLTVWLVLRWMQRSLGLAPPTAAQLAEENHDAHALFRHVPCLKTGLAWRQLGSYPTPIHSGSVRSPFSNRIVRFLVKREDLGSSIYGGNKVRGLQHQIAIVEARSTPTHQPGVLVIGSGGSNQVVATTAHMEAAAPGMHGRVSALWASKDLADLDNTLNMLSTLSYDLSQTVTWGDGLWKFLRALVGGWWGGAIILPPGGNNAAGVLGNASAALELAEQIEKGECEDPDLIILPVGSSCTISGIALGVALARHVGLKAFQKPGFRIRGVAIHHSLAKLRRIAQKLGIDRWTPLPALFPNTITNALVRTCGALRTLGGPDISLEANQVLYENVEVVADARVCGMYGGHSKESLAVSKAYDETGQVVDADGKEASPLWLCGHFTAKAFAALVEASDAATSVCGGRGTPPTLLFWQTKSAVQPRSEANDEFEALRQMPAAVLRWAERGAAQSTLRPGAVNPTTGSPGDYRHLMTQVPPRPVPLPEPKQLGTEVEKLAREAKL